MTAIMEANTDPIAELAAMQKVAEALEGFSPESAGRVLAWAASAFKAETGALLIQRGAPMAQAPEADAVEEEDQEDEFDLGSLAELFERANPSTEAQRVLVASYYFQEHQDHDDVDAYSINAELKHLGHGAGNITRAFAKLIKRKPSLVMQVRKSGSSQQARKRYRVTNEGSKAVRRMLNGEPE